MQLLTEFALIVPLKMIIMCFLCLKKKFNRIDTRINVCSKSITDESIINYYTLIN